MTWSPPEPTSVGAPPLRTPEDIHSHADVDKYKPVHLHLDWSIDWKTRTISGQVSHTIQLLTSGLSSITLDASHLNIKSVQVEAKQVDFKLGQQRGTLGAPLQIPIPSTAKEGDKINVSIDYSTTEQCTALGWLSKEQTAGKTNPFLYSQCQAIHCRSLVPCIDSPSHKITYTSTVRSSIPVLMSALKDHDKTDAQQPHVYHFKQPIGIPSYLIAIVGGDMEFRKLGERTGIWAEPPNADAVQWEFEADAERFLQHAEKVISPYSWTRYDSVVLPPSFPYGGMENANLTTLTPSLVCGDRSLTDVLLHELCHSWSGNLTSCANWKHFWLNEGWTVYLERLLLQSVHGDKEGPAHRGFSYIIGAKALHDALEQFSNNPRFQRLIPEFKDGEDPDDAFSSIPYEKGSNFLLHLERTVGGLQNFLPYAKSYFHAFFNRSVTTEEWKEHLFTYFQGNSEIIAKLEKVDWHGWLHGEGLDLPVKMEYDTTLAEQAFSLAARWTQVIQGKLDLESAHFNPSDIKGWNANQIVVFLERLHSGPKVPLSVTQRLDKTYGFSKATNGEVLLRFFEVALEVEGGKYAQQAAEWVKTQGRMKFCRTVYRALNKVEPELAKKTFLDNKSFYHPIAATQIEKDLGVTLTSESSERLQSGGPGPGDLIAIFGSTGTGKTKLSVEIAQAVAAAAHQTDASTCSTSSPSTMSADGIYGTGYENGEVISCDSMQIYKGLDIITNKATEEEMAGVQHHLMSFLDVGQEYDLTQFLGDTNRIVGEMRSRNTLPIICGGTTYYLQHLLFPGRTVPSAPKKDDPVANQNDDGAGPIINRIPDDVLQGLTSQEVELLESRTTIDSKKMTKSQSRSMVSAVAYGQVESGRHPEEGEENKRDPNSMELWRLLQKLDPKMAGRWHWRDTRKVSNSLRVFRETGVRHSEWIAKQDHEQQRQSHQQQNVSSSPGHLQSESSSGDTSEVALGNTDALSDRSSSTSVSNSRKLLFWVWCEPKILQNRLDDRVDDMVRRGLLSEVKELRRLAQQVLSDGDPRKDSYQNGIFQTIGYKPFNRYLDRLETLCLGEEPMSEQNPLAKKQSQDQDKDKKLKQKQQKSETEKWWNEAIEATKTGTRQYAKSQTKWILNKLIPEIRKIQRVVADSQYEGAGEVSLYIMDTSDPDEWDTKVKYPALQIVGRFLRKEPLPDPSTVSSPEVAQKLLGMGRTSNQSLSLFERPKSNPDTPHVRSNLGDGDGGAHPASEGLDTIEANTYYVCPVCTFDMEKDPIQVRLMDRKVHEKGKFHQNNVRKRKTPQQIEEEIQTRIQQGNAKRLQRLALKSSSGVLQVHQEQEQEVGEEKKKNETGKG